MSDTHLKRNGEYVYDVTLTKHEAGPLSCGYSASLGLVRSLKAGRLVSVEMKISDTYGFSELKELTTRSEEKLCKNV